MSIRITFGKHRGTPITELPVDYLEWMVATAKRDPFGAVGEFVDYHMDDIQAAMRPSVRAQRIPVDYALSDSQQAAVDALTHSLFALGHRHARLDGGAGYGKSFATMELVRRAMLNDHRVTAVATSYVATEVLKKQLEPIGVQARTIASALRLEKVEVEDRESYEVSSKTPAALAKLLGKGCMLIVDEGSMVNNELSYLMMNAAHQHGGKLLVVGDLKQLPPVGQDTPSAFYLEIDNVAELTEPMRYSSDSDLFALEQLARYQPENILNGGWVGSDMVTVHGQVSELIAQFVEDYHAAPTDDARMMFFRRSDVFSANAAIRARIFGDEAATRPIIEDERLMVLSTTDVLVPGEPKPVRYYSGETFLVTEAAEVEHCNVPCYRVMFHGAWREVHVIINVPGGRGDSEYKAELRRLRNEARDTGNWNAFKAFKRSFLLVGYNYAMTVHRCQGQTVDRTYFAPCTLQGSDMSDALTYVAGTRAKKHAHMARRG